MDGTIRTAALTNAAGHWCGSCIIEPGELAPQLQDLAYAFRDGQPVVVDVRTPVQRDWVRFPVDPAWLLPPAGPVADLP